MLWLKRLILSINRWSNSPIFLDDDSEVLTSWVSFLKNKEDPQIILYSFDNCPACAEISAWMNVEWVIFKKIICKPIFPAMIVQKREYQQFIMHKCTDKKLKLKKNLLLHPEFPQLELIADGKVEKKIFADVNEMKLEIKQFLQKHKVPGFISGDSIHDNTVEAPFGSPGTEDDLVKEREERKQEYEKHYGQDSFTPEDILSELQTTNTNANK